MPNDDIVAAYQQATDAPLTDHLTGLHSHGVFQLILGREIGRFHRYQTPVALGMLNLDGFKLYNTRHGPVRSDRMLKETGRIIRQNLRNIDLAARYSGDQFAVVLANSEADGASSAMERIRSAVERMSAGELTVSIGIASLPSLTSNCKENLIKQAESALQRAKVIAPPAKPEA